MLNRLVERVRHAFGGKPSIETLVVFYSAQISLAASACAQSAIANGERVDPERRYDLTFEFVTALLNLVDRKLFANDRERRDEIMDGLCAMTYSHLAEEFPSSEGFDQQMASLSEKYADVTQEFFEFKKNFPDKDDSPKGTFFWEFGKRFATACHHKDDIGYVTVGSTILVGALTVITRMAKKCGHQRN